MSMQPTSVILINNAPTDKTAAAVQRVFPEVVVLSNQENIGYAGGNNRGIRFAMEQGADYFFLLNNDVILSPDCLSVLLGVAESDPQIGMVGPKVYYFDAPKRIQSAGGIVTWRSRLTAMIGQGELDHGQYDRIRDVDFLCGCALLVKRTAIEVTGYLDPDFFIYYEDADWGLRMRRAGFRVVYVPYTHVLHVGSAEPSNDSAFRAYYNHRNALLLARKHAPWPRRWLIYLRSLRAVAKQCLRAITPSRRTEAVAALRGIRDFYLGRLGRNHYGLS